jgi:hypothetical protein
LNIKTQDSNPRAGRRARIAGLAACAMLAMGAGDAVASSGGIGTDDGSAGYTSGDKAKLKNGKAIAPRSAPRRVKRAIAAANDIVDKPYCWGGGHTRWRSRCYDCSGAISYALGDPGARIVDAPMASGGYMSWGRRGKGEWITVYADSGHMFAVIAGLRLDTSQTPGPGVGWSRDVRAGFVNVPKSAARHKGRL